MEAAHSPRRRRLISLLAGGLAVGAAGWTAARPVLVNPCRAALPPDLSASPWLQRAWAGLDASQVWDCHVHVAGTGDGGSGIEIGPQLSSWLYPVQYAQRLFYMNAGCTHDAPGQVDASYAARLRNLVEGMPAGFKVLLFAFERYHDEAGRPVGEHLAFHVPDDYARHLATSYPAGFEWVASIHPYRRDAVPALQAAIATGARAVKWLPAAMGMDPAAPRCDAFYRVLADAGVPLIVHGGEEKAVKGGDSQHLGNPLRLRRALDAGVRVVVAHCASIGQDVDTDGGAGGPLRPSFELFARMMDESRAKGALYGDISAVTQRNRPLAVLQTLLARTDWHDRLLHGSDYPLPGILPLTTPAVLARAGMLPVEAVADLEAVREHNPLLFDLSLKRLLRWQGRSLPAAVFETRRVFAGGPAPVSSS